ncbi:phosphoribosyl-AMP cyclohydrolase [Methanomicrobium antiquum]|uniref:Phosphoribosyl-AMP cyclohydrolase n=1 Tax=Methanomicrobium antiquum TaxID=487686 RepID=A0AAF0G0T9_9EURY|nr:phosphoribosyl-AMP cyclohydrolase [Methanomicrobium antiquum]MDD3976647.1 phosphoribosyl-AMP cyclohydrolase [Methanomicrobium sp.]WFN37969.1 phosphoribosyl-AMP cyclohydrolase [Methanomicrobium antiquum]
MDINYDKNGLVTVVVQDNKTGKILMVAWSNKEAVELTIKTGYAHYFSRSRKKIWKKGEESGHVQKITEILIDCDCDALLYKVHQEGGACHTGYDSCFYRTVDGKIVGNKIFDPDKVYAN